MEVGTILVDQETGVKLLVVEPPIAGTDVSSVSVNGRPLAKEFSRPGGDTKAAGILSLDPGARG